MVLIGDCQSSGDESEDDKIQNYDSTASTPKVLRKVVHKVVETERKASNTNFTADLGTNSAPPHGKTKNEGKRKISFVYISLADGSVNSHYRRRLMESLSKTKGVWYLPTPFAQYALDWRQTPQEVRKIFHKDLMSKQDFILVNDQGVHWYLMAIDVLERKLVLLDSLPCPKRNYLTRREVLKLAISIEKILSIESIGDVNSSNSISNFCIVQSRSLPTQCTGS
ncbi:Ulp1 protease family, carboxy-terminal domain protein [Medicago truncatula]|uniref:Ulp1 protease family, carboxy-terminal domain protein n=2 Tax=Medicago truncatula TaxID=3880 RepID=A0A072TR85_MEDTR|nr:Ulp1 protease family, carboxy-terminal domain protein [Medicago truncatula]